MCATEAGVAVADYEIIDTEHSHEAAARGAELAAQGKVGASGLRTERRISHAFLMSIANYPKPFIITDAAVNIEPDLAAKAAREKGIIFEAAGDAGIVLGARVPIMLTSRADGPRCRLLSLCAVLMADAGRKGQVK